jgi:alkylation response protein AidB-like acyl-CoA dehydrogenase
MSETRLFDGGLRSPAVAAYRARVRAHLEAAVEPLLAEAERERRFPRQAVEELGAAGFIAERWAAGGDHGKAVVLAEELGGIGAGGVGVGVSLHMEAVTSLLVDHARAGGLTRYRDGALSGALVGCLATSEEDVGSDLASLSTTIERCEDGYAVRGRKWFVSPGGAADFCLVLGRIGDPAANGAASLALAVVDREDLHVEKRLETVGMRSLETVRLGIDTVVRPDRVIGAGGQGLLLVEWALTHERLAIAAQAVGVAGLALRLATSHVRARRQFGARLFDHQAVRLRLADLAAQVSLATAGIEAIAAGDPRRSLESVREIAGAKVTATRLAQRVVDECAQLFGGRGYLEDETPLGRLWRDIRVGRLGAGADEVMWELVATGLRGDDHRYSSFPGAVVAPERKTAECLLDIS